MSTTDRALRLHLYGQQVATLLLRTTGEQPVYHLFFEPSYIDAIPRPVLTLAARDWRLDAIRRFSARMPPFLTNLLPERGGALRSRILAAARLADADEFGLLEFVGQDMSGAVTVEPGDAALPSGKTVDQPAAEAASTQRLRWSLGGVQLKFSVDRTDRLSLPVSGRGGRWILKIPDRTRPDLPRAEFAAMEWAREAGFDVPTLEIVDPRNVDGLSPDAFESVPEALLVRRFDRNEDRSPVHMEELTSVLGIHPEHKYPDDPSPHRYNLVALGRLVKRLAGEGELRTFISRIVFDVLAGNGDAHIKNWAFLFPDRRTPRLAPVFDVVPTIFYGFPPELALPLTSERAFRAIDGGRIRQFALKLASSPDEVTRLVRETVERAVAGFDRAMERTGLPKERVDALRQHWENLPLLRI